ncbi:MAG: heme biosynthesis HemY N-terminal domain-containing protein [Porticoccaceae bacterium]|nr:heme biosynthesis HemY N-terminal domain-containing protein [Porticoccaceae bacterium]
MRKMLLILMLALSLGAAGIWMLQQDSGYILVSFGNTNIEMSIWVGIFLYVALSVVLIWLFLLVRWLASAGGLRLWWGSFSSARHISKTAQGLMLYAQHDWQKASQLLSQSADKSSMPVINLLFAARAAADSNDLEKARQLLQRLKISYPNEAFSADKLLAELLIIDENFVDARPLIEELYRAKPSDRAILRLLADTYYLTGDWRSLQKILHDLSHYGALSRDAATNLEIDTYLNLLLAYIPDPELNEAEQQDNLIDLWDLVPKSLRRLPELICAYADALQKVNGASRLQPIIAKALNASWHADLVERFGQLQSDSPQRQLAVAEKWLPDHVDDPDLLLALGRICRRAELPGKARDYLTAATSINPCPETYLELAELLDSMNDQSSAEMYRHGLLIGLQLER